MISALFMIAGIHSIANLKKLVNERAKKDYNSENTHSSFEVPIEDMICLLLMCLHFTWQSIRKLNLCY